MHYLTGPETTETPPVTTHQLLAILDFARIASALVVVVGVTSILGAELLLVLEGVGLRAWVLTIAQRCYDCEE